jgi:TRAP-type C4-dicarboxylate transport system permease small subunit
MSLALTENAKRLNHLFCQLEKWVLVFLIGFLAVFSILQIVLRNFFSTSLVWGDDLLRHGVLWVSFLGAARATAESKHIRIDLLPRLLPAWSKYVTDLICSFFSCLVCLVLLWASWNFVTFEKLAGDTAFAAIPYWWLEVIFPFSFALMALRFFFIVLDGVLRGPKGIEP